MKTLEEKARAYDEALERARKLYNSEETSADVEIACETIFPELAESEDERIRKMCMRYLDREYQHCSFADDKKNIEKCIAWLEKQGEHKDYYTKQELVDMGFSFTLNGDIVTPDKMMEDMKKYLTWLEKQSEQKPADKVEPKFKVKYAGNEYNVFETKDIAGVTFYGIEDEPNHIDYVKAENCEIISVYAIKENGSPYPTKPAVFSEKKPKRMISAEAKEAMYDKPACVGRNDTLLDLLNKIPSCITVDGIDYHFVMKKTSYYTAYYKGNREEYSGNAIFGITAFSPIDLLTDMLEELKKEGLLE